MESDCIEGRGFQKTGKHKDGGTRERRRATGRSIFSSSRISRPTKITYGKKTTNLLPLSARHFRSSVYDITLDNESDEQLHELLMAGGLGDAGNDEEPKGRDEDDSQPDAVEILRSAFLGRSAQASSVPQCKNDKTKKPVASGMTWVPRPGQLASPRAVEKLTHAKYRPRKANQSVASRKELITPARRLPVNELFMVASPPHHTGMDPTGSYHGVESQDPITNVSSSPRKHNISPVVSDDERSAAKAVKTRLSDIRRRLTAPKWRHESFQKARRSKTETTMLMQTKYSEHRGRDGFATAELVVCSRPLSRPRKQQRAHPPLTPRFNALQLGNGLLPDVEFVSPIKSELQAHSGVGYDIPVRGAGNDERLRQHAGPSESQHSKRRVSFDSRLREERIRVELSSISAPMRAPSESVSDDEHDDEEVKMESECIGEQDQEVSDGSILPDDSDGEEAANNAEDAEYTDLEDNSAVDRGHSGVTLDLRRPALLGQTSLSRSMQRRALMEVNERIVEVPDASPATLFSIHSATLLPAPAAHSPRPTRIKSILKNSTPMVLDRTSRPKHTESNTRRNSIVEVEESRYFTNATHRPLETDRTRHIIVPRRRSSYHDHVEVEVPHTDLVVPQTSPQQIQYRNYHQLNVLRRTSEATWTSTMDPAPPKKDMKALTRTVSREHGTLSQSVRRRSSFPFQSPTKSS